jgi:Lon protease-like protein
MSESHLAEFSDESFSGVTRLFPLPNLVMFPHVVQALHIFEPRYRRMLEDALSADRLIAMALLVPGWERDYEGRPPIYPVTCLSQIIHHTRLEDGHYNILIFGLRRARLLHELPPVRMYREARVELLPDQVAGAGDPLAQHLLEELLAAIDSLMPESPLAQGQFGQLLGSQLTLGVLTDLLAYTLDLDRGVKHRLLCETDVECRARLILDCVRASGEGQVAAGQAFRLGFPPVFSLN